MPDKMEIASQLQDHIRPRYVHQFELIQNKANAQGVTAKKFRQLFERFSNECLVTQSLRKQLEDAVQVVDVRQYEFEKKFWRHLWPHLPFPGVDPRASSTSADQSTKTLSAKQLKRRRQKARRALADIGNKIVHQPLPPISSSSQNTTAFQQHGGHEPVNDGIKMNHGYGHDFSRRAQGVEKSNMTGASHKIIEFDAQDATSSIPAHSQSLPASNFTPINVIIPAPAPLRASPVIQSSAVWYVRDKRQLNGTQDDLATTTPTRRSTRIAGQNKVVNYKGAVRKTIAEERRQLRDWVKISHQPKIWNKGSTSLNEILEKNQGITMAEENDGRFTVDYGIESESESDIEKYFEDLP